MDTPQRQVRDQLVALQVCHGGDQRMFRANLVIAVCRQHHCGGLRVAHQVTQQGQRRLVGPVQVVDHNEQRRRPGQRVDHRCRGLVQPVSLCVRVAGKRRGQVTEPMREPGDQPDQVGRPAVDQRVQGLAGEVGGELSERLGEWLVGDYALLVAASPEHPGAPPVCGAGELARKAGLADTRVAGHERDLRGAGRGRVEQGVEPVELCRPAYEWGGVAAELRRRG
jgi:hypothetical protein